MATTTNYGWTTPDDTALVKDGAAAIRTLGTSVDTTTKALNPSTTLGDVEYRSSTANTNTRLGIGSTGQVLTVAGGVPTWATPAGGGSNWSLLNAGGTALTGASTITISGISGKDKIMVIMQNGSSTNASAFAMLQINTDTAANYFMYGSRITTSITNIATSDDGFYFTRMSDNASSVMAGYCIISGCNSSGVKQILGSGAGSAAGGTSNEFRNLAGYYSGSSTVSSISLKVNTGDWDAGTVYVYTSAS
jgi:hypothetical protein